MKVQLLLMVKNGEDTLLKTLNSYVGYVDRFYICDTGSTDNTMSILKDFKRKHENVVVKRIEFTGFSETRNEVMDLSYDFDFHWSIFIDDSYELVDGPELIRDLKSVLHDPNVHCLTIDIHRDNMVYKSRRIVRTYSRIRWKGSIHENLNCVIGHHIEKAYINDIPSAKQLTRSMKRLDYDIKMLEGLEDPRSLYYKACNCIKLFALEKVGIDKPLDALNKRLSVKCNNPEEKFVCLLHLSNLELVRDSSNDACRYLLEAASMFPGRAGEAYYTIYLITNSEFFLTKAYDSRYYKQTKLALNTGLYSNAGVGEIEKMYDSYLYSKLS